MPRILKEPEGWRASGLTNTVRPEAALIERDSMRGLERVMALAFDSHWKG